MLGVDRAKEGANDFNALLLGQPLWVVAVLATASLALLVLVVCFLCPWAWRALTSRAAVSRPSLPLASLVAGALFASLLAPCLPAPQNFQSKMLAGGGFAIAGPAAVVAHRRHRKTYSVIEPGGDSMLAKVLGKSGFEALEGWPEEDRLQRAELVALLAGVLTRRESFPMTIGLEGKRGSGKSSLLNALHKRLQDQVPVVRLNAWAYREPHRLLDAYFEMVGEAIDHTHDGRIKRELRAMTRSLADLSGSRLAAGAVRLMDGDKDSTVESRRKVLEPILRSLPTRLVVFADDLDRLEEDELSAVVRAIRLVGTLPNISHVLSYDRQYLAARLGLSTESATSEYLAKVIGVEISISSPFELLSAMLEASLQPLLNVDEREQEGLQRSIVRFGARRLIAILSTPRDVQRVAANTAVIWAQQRRHVNLPDVFFTRVLQLKFPEVFEFVRAHPVYFCKPESFVEFEMMWHREESKKRASEYLKELDESDDLRPAADVLRHLFPDLAEDPSETASSGLRERVVQHAEHFERYFHFFTPSAVYGIADLEELGQGLLRQPAGEPRRDWLIRELQEARETGRIESLIDRLGMLVEHDGAVVEADLALQVDVVSAVAAFSSLLDSREGFMVSSLRRRAAFFVMDMAKRTPDERIATQIIDEAITRAGTLAFAGDLMFYVERPERGKEVFGGKVLEKDVLRRAFLGTAKRLFDESGRILLQSEPEEVSGAFQLSFSCSWFSERAIRELSADPTLLPQLLRVWAPMQTAPNYGRIVAEQFDPAEMAKYISLKDVESVTRSVPLEMWAKTDEREIVRRFRSAAVGDASGDSLEGYPSDE